MMIGQPFSFNSFSLFFWFFICFCCFLFWNCLELFLLCISYFWGKGVHFGFKFFLSFFGGEDYGHPTYYLSCSLCLFLDFAFVLVFVSVLALFGSVQS